MKPALATNSISPQYDSMETRQLLDKMISHHGGKDNWLKFKTLGFTHSLFILGFPKNLNPWWISEEQFQRENRRGYQFYPMESSLLVFKNSETWAQQWKLPNPPGMMPYFNYNFIFLPWLTLEDGAVLTSTGKRKLPNDEREYSTVKLQFTKDFIQTPDDYFRLFIDFETGEVKGVEYNSTYAPLLDGMKISGNEFGPGFHVYESYKEISGLKITQHYSTYFGGELAGTHAITNISINNEYDEVKAHRKGEYIKVDAHPTKRVAHN